MALLVSGSSLYWMAFTGAVMFDLMLTFFVLLGVSAVAWAAAGGGSRAWVLVGWRWGWASSPRGRSRCCTCCRSRWLRPLVVARVRRPTAGCRRPPALVCRHCPRRADRGGGGAGLGGCRRRSPGGESVPARDLLEPVGRPHREHGAPPPALVVLYSPMGAPAAGAVAVLSGHLARPAGAGPQRGAARPAVRGSPGWCRSSSRSRPFAASRCSTCCRWCPRSPCWSARRLAMRGGRTPPLGDAGAGRRVRRPGRGAAGAGAAAARRPTGLRRTNCGACGGVSAHSCWRPSWSAPPPARCGACGGTRRQCGRCGRAGRLRRCRPRRIRRLRPARGEPPSGGGAAGRPSDRPRRQVPRPVSVHRPGCASR